jgi:DNA-directed RNA polymerase specialized sigma24 family protein
MTDDPADAEWDVIAALAARLPGEEDLWPAFWGRVSPHLESWAASPGFVGRLAVDDDHRREIVVLSWEKLQDGGGAKLRAFFERPADDARAPGRRFRVWLRRVVKNLAIDYMRALPEFVRRRAPAPVPASPSAVVPSHHYWRSIVSLASHAAIISGEAEGRAEAQRMLDFLDAEISPRRRRAVELADAGQSPRAIARALGLRNAAEAERIVARARERLKFRAALELWSHGYGDDEIAERLGLADGAAADRMIKAAKELLRRAFA